MYHRIINYSVRNLFYGDAAMPFSHIHKAGFFMTRLIFKTFTY